MKRIVTGLATLLAVTVVAQPALAGGDWDDDDYYSYEYERHGWRDEYHAYAGVPVHRAPAYEVFIPYGTYFADEPDVYGPGCKIERKWKRGRYKEKIECDDDD